SLTLWDACAAELQQRTSQRAKPQWNLWLDSGVIRTHLSIFTEHSRKVPRSEMDLLHSLRGKVPMQLVINRQERTALQRAAGVLPGAPPSPWLVHPDLHVAHQSGGIHFKAGQTYSIDCKSIDVIRHKTRPNLAGADEELEFQGQ